ncbi:MAG: 16S rRNA (adenine(1518)-N(6)/adenine(1519)-N(6))-dimethyltransferase RsmA [Candidatus Paceibacterota bacterium]
MSKKLGQHFLKNKAKIHYFIKPLEIEEGDTIIEIGPGKGVITKELKNKGVKLICVEKDEKLGDKLIEKGYEVIKQDILKILPKISQDIGNYKLVGNIPYYITGKLLRTIEELGNKPFITVLGIQKQVAERLTAEPPKMNILAASVKFWADTKIITNIPKTDFSPPPKVDGAIVSLKTKDENFDSGIYYKAVKTIFKHPRKTIANNLDIGLKERKGEIKEILESAGILPFWRPENLSIKDIKKLSQKLY